MRELTATEIDQVGGGGMLSEFVADAGAAGSIYGAIVTNTVYGAVRGGAIGALAGATFGASFGITSWVLDQLS